MTGDIRLRCEARRVDQVRQGHDPAPLPRSKIETSKPFSSSLGFDRKVILEHLLVLVWPAEDRFLIGSAIMGLMELLRDKKHGKFSNSQGIFLQNFAGILLEGRRKNQSRTWRHFQRGYPKIRHNAQMRPHPRFRLNYVPCEPNLSTLFWRVDQRDDKHVHDEFSWRIFMSSSISKLDLYLKRSWCLC